MFIDGHRVIQGVPKIDTTVCDDAGPMCGVEGSPLKVA